MAEYFRDMESNEVFFLVDSVSRYLQAGSEVSALLGHLPAEMGYQLTLASDLALVEGRAAAPAWIGITSVQAIYVPAADLTDPAVAGAFTRLDSAVVLSRERAARGLYPAAASSQLLDPNRVGERHCEVARLVRQTIERYRQLEDVIVMLGAQELREEDQLAAQRARRLERFLTQPLFVAESFTGQPGRRVSLEDTHRLRGHTPRGVRRRGRAPTLHDRGRGGGEPMTGAAEGLRPAARPMRRRFERGLTHGPRCTFLRDAVRRFAGNPDARPLRERLGDRHGTWFATPNSQRIADLTPSEDNTINGQHSPSRTLRPIQRRSTTGLSHSHNGGAP
jgi:hypothetical protein